MAGAADPLQAAGHRLRRLDLDHQVDGPHVDAQLQRGGGDQARQLPGLQQLLDDRPLLVRERPMVGAGNLDVLAGGGSGEVPSDAELLPRCHDSGGSVEVASPAVARVLGRRQLLLAFAVRQLVQALGEPLGGAAVVDEDDGRGVFLDQLQQLGVDRRPDRADVGWGSISVGRRPVLARVGGAPGRPCPRPGRRSRGRAPSAARHRRSRTPASARPGTARSAPAAAGWPTARSAGPLAVTASRIGEARRSLPASLGESVLRPPAARPGRRAAPGSAPGASRAWSARPRGSRRRSPLRPRSRISRDLRGEHQVERLRGGDQDVRRGFAPSPAVLSARCRRCAGRPRSRRRSRAAAPAGCARCRRRALSAARRRRA